MTNESATSSPTTATPATFGQMLKTLREQQGYSLKEVALQLRLTEALLQSLEAGEMPPGVPTTFVRGYLRAYGRFLGLENADITAQLTAIAPAISDTPPHPLDIEENITSSNYLIQFFTVLIACTLLGLMGTWWYMHDANNDTPPPPVTQMVANMPDGGNLTLSPPVENTNPPVGLPVRSSKQTQAGANPALASEMNAHYRLPTVQMGFPQTGSTAFYWALGCMMVLIIALCAWWRSRKQPTDRLASVFSNESSKQGPRFSHFFSNLLASAEPNPDHAKPWLIPILSILLLGIIGASWHYFSPKQQENTPAPAKKTQVISPFVQKNPVTTAPIKPEPKYTRILMTPIDNYSIPVHHKPRHNVIPVQNDSTSDDDHSEPQTTDTEE